MFPEPRAVLANWLGSMWPTVHMANFGIGGFVCQGLAISGFLQKFVFLGLGLGLSTWTGRLGIEDAIIMSPSFWIRNQEGCLLSLGIPDMIFMNVETF